MNRWPGKRDDLDMSIAAGLSATKTGFELLKGLREYLKREDIDPAEVNARLLELQEYLLDARNALSEAQGENRELRRSLDENNALKSLGEDLEITNSGFCIRRSEKPNSIPYCPVCWGENQKLVPLKPVANDRYHLCDS